MLRAFAIRFLFYLVLCSSSRRYAASGKVHLCLGWYEKATARCDNLYIFRDFEFTQLGTVIYIPAKGLPQSCN